MNTNSISRRRTAASKMTALLALVVVFVAAGCMQDDTSRYKAPRAWTLVQHYDYSPTTQKSTTQTTSPARTTVKSSRTTTSQKKGFWGGIASLFSSTNSSSGSSKKTTKPATRVKTIPVSKSTATRGTSAGSATYQTSDNIAEPRLRAGIPIKITVMAGGDKIVDEPAKRVSSTGIITLPLIGNVTADGLTIAQLSAQLTKRYAEYLQSPMVDVEFVLEDSKETISPWGYVTVLGRVKNPGKVNIPPTRDLSLSMAIQTAGGIDTSAKLTGIKITRKNAKQETIQFEVDLQSVGMEGDVEKDVRLEPGDVVFVPEKVF